MIGSKRQAAANSALGLAALILSAAVIISLSSQSRRYERDATNRSGDYARNAEREIATRCRPSVTRDRPNCVNEARQAAREYQRKEQDLAAQWVTAWWTQITGAAAVAGVILSAFGVFLVWRTFRAAQEGNEISRQAMMAENRAWVEIRNDIVLSDWIFSDGQFQVEIGFFTKNVGKSVALEVNAHAAIVREPLFGNDDKPIRALIQDMKEPRDNFLAYTLFPNRNDQHSFGMRVDPKEIEITYDGKPEGEDHSYAVAICLSVQYRTVFDRPDDPLHHTIEVYNIKKRDDRGRPGIMIRGKGVIPADRLGLARSYHNWGEVT